MSFKIQHYICTENYGKNHICGDSNIFFFLKYFSNEDNWPRTMQNDNFLLKCCLLLELGQAILYF